MNENQNIEYKQNWRDEYLKWIAGFANASGGKIYIGLDNTGKAVGLNNAHKLMLWNEGRLPEDFTIETLLGKHPSRPFNKNVADIFFKAGFIEAWGRGIAKITNGFKNEGLDIPVFEATMGGILVTINRPVYNKNPETKDRVTDKVTDKVTDRITGKIPCNVTDNVTNNVTDNVTDKVVDNVTNNITDNVVNNVVNNVVDNVVDNEKEILNLLKYNPKLSAKELAKKTNLSSRSVQRYLKILREKKHIERIGPPKGGHWKIIEHN